MSGGFPAWYEKRLAELRIAGASTKCPECSYPLPSHHWSCRSKNTYTPPMPPKSPECPCGIDRRDCEYHRA